LDSVLVTVNQQSQIGTNPTATAAVGGTLMHGPRVINSDFYVLMKNGSTIAGDTVRLYRTDSKAMNWPAPWTEKYSDNYGVVRFGGKFYTSENYDKSPGFGVGSNYEFLVAPIVQYEIWAAHEFTADQPDVPTFKACTWTPYS